MVTRPTCNASRARRHQGQRSPLRSQLASGLVLSSQLKARGGFLGRRGESSRVCASVVARGGVGSLCGAHPVSPHGMVEKHPDGPICKVCHSEPLGHAVWQVQRQLHVDQVLQAAEEAHDCKHRGKHVTEPPGVRLRHPCPCPSRPSARMWHQGSCSLLAAPTHASAQC